MIAPEDARGAWARLAADGRPIRSRQLTPAQLALVAAVADTINPRITYMALTARAAAHAVEGMNRGEL